jgi:hypothetical protein
VPRAKLGHVEDPTAPNNAVHDERWQERGGFGDGGRGGGLHKLNPDDP